MSAANATLILFAKAPEPGRVKTRLAPLLTGEGAARLYRGFLEDAARVYVQPQLWASVLAADSDPEHPFLQSLFPPPWRRIAQVGEDLGERLCVAFEGEVARGAKAVLAVGSDHPALPGERLRRAFEAIRAGADAALIPAEDGGYCAIALSARAAPAAVFRDIPWSSASVLAVTRTRLAEAGLSVVTLEAAYDVDRPEDVERLRGDIARDSPHAPDYPSATARALQELEREGAL